jgi:hypothetical protein
MVSNFCYSGRSLAIKTAPVFHSPYSSSFVYSLSFSKELQRRSSSGIILFFDVWFPRKLRIFFFFFFPLSADEVRFIGACFGIRSWYLSRAFPVLAFKVDIEDGSSINQFTLRILLLNFMKFNVN